MKEDRKSGDLYPVTLEIFGDVYKLKADDPEGLKMAGQLVDFTMRSFSKQAQSFGGSRMAVLTALKIAEDYLQLKKDYDELVTMLEEHK